jgi:hypothetical protein
MPSLAYEDYKAPGIDGPGSDPENNPLIQKLTHI